MWKRIVCPIALALIAALLFFRAPQETGVLPGTVQPQRQLVRVWMLSSIGGGQAWLREALRAYEKQHPGVMTYLRQATAEDLVAEDAVLPDLVLYMPGDLTDASLFLPLSGQLNAEEALLRCGRWRGEQVGLPLCWAGYVLAVSSALDGESAVTPAPTTLLGRAAATAAPNATATPGFPLEAAMAAGEAVQCAPGAGLFTLSLLLETGTRPSLPESFSTMRSSAVYQRYQSGQCASALLTTGQAVALDALIAAGSAPPTRYLLPSEVITDQVWLGSVVRGGSDAVAELLAFLTGDVAQKLLSTQGLQPALPSLRLYAEGVPAGMARAAARGLTVVNAYVSPQDTTQSAWQVYQGNQTLRDALLPLL